MKRNITKLILLTFICVACAPAMPKQGPFIQVASTREINVRNLNLNNLTKRTSVEGKVCSFCPGAPFVRGCEPSLGDAVEDALQKGKGDLLLDSNVKINGYLLVSCTSVKGTVIDTKEAE